jgi:hypothetical protein
MRQRNGEGVLDAIVSAYRYTRHATPQQCHNQVDRLPAMVISSVGSQAGDRRSATLILSANACAGFSLVDSITLASVLLDCTSCRYNASVTGSFTGVPLLVSGVAKTLSRSSKHGGFGSKSKSRKNCAVVSVVRNSRTAAQRAKVVRLLQRQVEQAVLISLSSRPRTADHSDQRR